ncbi:MAG: hypothetical protein SO170_05455 [Butyribacter sp.]|nr:hypothetical protein [bacterium]MDY3854396.1 hypothetical protein [Butyribacter sp.]
MKKLVKNIVVASAAVAITAIANVAGGQATVSQAAGVEINQTTFKDSGVYSKVQYADKNKDGILSSEEAASIEDLYFTDATNDISAVLKYFPKVTRVELQKLPAGTKTITVNSTKIKMISISTKKVVSIKGATPAEVVIDASGTKSAFDFSKATGYSKVKEFYFYGSGAKKVVAPNQSKLTSLYINGTAMTSYDTSKLKSLKVLNLSNNKLKKVNVSKNKKLTSLACYNNKLSALNLSSNKNLKDVGAGDNNLKKLDVSKNKKITSVVAYRNKLKSLNCGKGSKITGINVSVNKLTKMELKTFKSLKVLNVCSNKIKKLDVSKNTKLTYLYCADNPVKTLALSKLKKLRGLNVAKTSVSKLPLAKGVKLEFISVGKKYQLLKKVKMKENYGISVYMQLSPNKKYDLTSIMPDLKGYEFTGYSNDMTISPSGKEVSIGKYKKNDNLYVYGIKGQTGVTVMLNQLGLFY